MSREAGLYLQDIRQACDRIRTYVDGKTREELLADNKTFDAVVRNLEIIGEAAKHIPNSIREKMPSIPFREIGDMRNILAHAYFGIDEDILWDVITNHLGPLRDSINELLQGAD